MLLLICFCDGINLISSFSLTCCTSVRFLFFILSQLTPILFVSSLFLLVTDTFLSCLACIALLITLMLSLIYLYLFILLNLY